MEEKLVIVADLGMIKAFRLETTLRGTLHLEPLEETILQPAHQKLSDRITDMAGRRGAPTFRNWGSPIAEENKLELEFERRWLKEICQHIKKQADANQGRDIWLAAPKEINHKILNTLPPPLRQRVQTSLSLDLVNVTKQEIIDSFAPARVSRVPVTSGIPPEGQTRETPGSSTTKRRQPRFHTVPPPET